MHIVGTAGHVDHGKSSLVRALTGTDPDRWVEEQLRGMTLDLGFALLSFEDGVEAGIVDVPGHERFLHNMLAGAAGMELLLLVIAANEGVRPQTLEHLEILRYLNVRRTIVVLSKADLLAPDELAFAAELVGEELRGTPADGAKLVTVSTKSGEGLAALRSAIHAALLALAPRAPEAPPYLPIDRVFARAGFGTVVTGTLMQGTLAVGDELQLIPLGRRVRVRGLQVFGTAKERVAGGARVAVNLPGVEREELRRGAVLAAPEFSGGGRFAVRFRPRPAARALLRRRTPVRAYIGSAEILGVLVFERPPAADEPELSAQLVLREPTLAVAGGPFVVRRLSPKTLLGGGTFGTLEASAPGGEADAFGHDDDSPEERALLAALRAAGTVGTGATALGAAANLREERAHELLERFAEEGRALRLARPPGYLDAAAGEELYARVDALLRAGERARPWALGIPLVQLARRLEIAGPALGRLLAPAVEDGRLNARGGYLATAGFVPAPNAAQRALFDVMLAGDPAPGTPIAAAQVLAALHVSKVEGIADAFETLLASGAVVRVGDSFYRGSQIARIRAVFEAELRRAGRISPAAFRDLIGTSRKYAVPLLEWFDAAGVTLRSGDDRILRAAPERRATTAMEKR
ncbi:MAG: selenocysteine-specific translation elongation factor [Vulcanimicrobiaceae bacterium]